MCTRPPNKRQGLDQVRLTVAILSPYMPVRHKIVEVITMVY
jgi:hypothetical protein